MTWLLAVDELSREAARRAARRELQDRRYEDAQPPLLARVIGRGLRELGRLLDAAAANAPGGGLGLLLLTALVVLFVAIVLTRLSPTRRARPNRLFDSGRALTAQDHRRQAEQAAAAGRWPDAIRERLRAAVRELESRGVLEPRAGRTAGEVARDATAAVPTLAEPLTAATRAFDEVWYGGRPGDAQAYALLVHLDDTITSTRLVTA
ncbi:MAG: DUF4129 domain-containing protein [Mycobacteriales bacterium]